jgi:hypothetical protein
MRTQRKVPVSFRILERNDGGSVHIVFAGPRETKIQVVGTVEGQGSPRLIEMGAISLSRRSRHDEVVLALGRFVVVALVTILFASVAFSIEALVAIRFVGGSFKDRMRKSASLWAGIAAGIVIATLMAIFLDPFFGSVPPFGFD